MSAHDHIEDQDGRDFGSDRSPRYRLRRPDALRHRNKSPTKVRGPGGIRQRRNKHWSW